MVSYIGFGIDDTVPVRVGNRGRERRRAVGLLYFVHHSDRSLGRIADSSLNHSFPRDAEVGRNDLVLPFLYMDVPALEGSVRRQNDPVL